MTFQRSKNQGGNATFYLSAELSTPLGDVRRTYDPANAVTVRTSMSAGRVTADGVADQQDQGEYVTLRVALDERLDSWCVVFWNGLWWDVAEPPRHHYGYTRHVRYTSVVCRRRLTPPEGV